jgi:release factor glutamine methyltransferase
MVSETHAQDAQVLLAHILRKSRAWVLTHPEYELDREEEDKLDRALEELRQGRPLPYVLGSWEFYGLEFQITTDVLIPRPETELLVKRAIDWLKEHTEKRWAADIGTGCGCIAVALAYQVRDLHLTASDISNAALKLAKFNAWRHDVNDRIDFILADLLPPVSRAYDLICANLPYIPTDTLSTLKVFEREPSLALDGGVEGLTFIRRLLEQSRHQISPGGSILLEIEASQGAQVKELAENLFPHNRVQVWTDLAGHERLLEINLII